ncbi:MAG TPA: prepilin-type N-terminal cleavage/methylation domain-containing protein [Rhodocyclaceae bacterium]|nr:prepilin-type N-terminal cleavage/methylation domain-containing protein [Rhodocyclaceae bacterium]
MRSRNAGFTLVEAIIAITITGIIGAAVAVFMRGPIDAYMAQSQRAEMVDIADTAIRRMARELRLSVPNSVRVAGGNIEFLLATAGGRYRFDVADEACFTIGCTSLVTRGSVVSASGEFVGNRVVIYNQYNNAGADCSNTNPSAYCGQNTSTLTGTTDGGTTDTLTFTNKKFVPENGSDSRRVIIFQGPVTYACEFGELRRYSGYAVTATQQPTASLGAAAVLATNVDCAQTSFVYTPGTYETWGVVGLTLTLTRNGETITLYHEAHIDNAP